MHRDHDQNARTCNGMRDARTHVNRQKGRRGIETPRTIGEQLAELVEVDAQGRRRRDPLHAAAAQHVRRDNGVGGAWIDTSQRANASFPDIRFEKYPGRHEARADARRLHP